MISKLKKWLVIGVMIAIFSGCSMIADETLLTEVIPTFSAYYSATPSGISPSSTVALTKINTVKIQPTTTKTVVPDTSTLVPTQNLKILSTLSKGSQWNVLFNLLHYNALCSLPCWFGITPGETTTEDVEKQLSTLGFTYFKDIEADGNIRFNNWLATSGPVNHDFIYSVTENVVDYIQIKGEGIYNPEEFHRYWKEYAPEIIIPTYGPPDRVRIEIYEYPTPYEKIRYDLYVFYDNLGIMVIYNGKGMYSFEENETFYRICPKWAEPTRMPYLEIYLQSPDNEKPLEKLLSYPIWDAKLIEDVTNIDENEFYTLLSTPGAEVCFESPIGIWKK